MKYSSGIVVFAIVLFVFSQRAFTQEKETIADKHLRITIGNSVLTAVLIDNETTRDFLTMLPMTVRASDYVSREKYWHLPRALTAKTDRQSEYERGDLGFWAPNNDMALFYNHDGTELPTTGLIVIAKIISGLNVFNRYPGSVELKIKIAD
jgi:hypothetical protein